MKTEFIVISTALSGVLLILPTQNVFGNIALISLFSKAIYFHGFIFFKFIFFIFLIKNLSRNWKKCERDGSLPAVFDAEYCIDSSIHAIYYWVGLRVDWLLGAVVWAGHFVTLIHRPVHFSRVHCAAPMTPINERKKKSQISNRYMFAKIFNKSNVYEWFFEEEKTTDVKKRVGGWRQREIELVWEWLIILLERSVPEKFPDFLS